MHLPPDGLLELGPAHGSHRAIEQIQGFSETLLGGALEDPADRRRFVRIIDRHARRLARLVEDLLTVSTLESEKELRRERMDLGELAAEQAAARPKGSRRDVVVLNDVPLGLWVSVERRYIMLALEQLLGNAVRFNKPRGRVWIEGRALQEHVRLTVRDEGIGISPEDLRRVFDRFFRVEKGDSGGEAGLGLHIVKKIVEAHGGRIWAESEPGLGSAFHVLLPSLPHGS